MEPISNAGQLIEILRKQLTKSQNRTDVSKKTSSKPEATASATPHDIGAVRQNIREKLQRINSNDPKAEQKSIRIFLESVLLWEFGDRLMDDPKFYALLDDVQHSMESDPVVRESLAALMLQLK